LGKKLSIKKTIRRAESSTHGRCVQILFRWAHKVKPERLGRIRQRASVELNNLLQELVKVNYFKCKPRLTRRRIARYKVILCCKL